MRLLSIFTAFVGLSLGGVNAEAACTVPNTLTNGTIADATQVMGNFNSVLGCVNTLPAGSTNGLQYNAGSGTFGSVNPLTNGQIPIGTTGGAPAAANITAGPGIAITNGPGSIMVSAASTPYIPPVLSNFTWGNQPTGSTAANTSTGLVFTTPYQPGDDVTELWDNSSYSSPYEMRVGVNFSTVASPVHQAGIGLGDGTGRLIFFTLVNRGGSTVLAIERFNAYNSYNSDYVWFISPSTNLFLYIKDDGTNLSFYIATDVNAPVLIYQVSRTDFFPGGPTQRGLMLNGADPSGSHVNTSGVFYDYEMVTSP
jgi:hypothetical protein